MSYRSSRPQRVEPRAKLIPPLFDRQRRLAGFQLFSLRNSTEEVKITNVELLASYNWMGYGLKTILVPGMSLTTAPTLAKILLTIFSGAPPRWLRPVKDIKLREDQGEFYRDRNAAQYPVYPVEAGVRSIFTVHPTFMGQSVDLFACSNTIGSLVAFVSGIDKNFRFSAEKLGNTLFLDRRENNPMEAFQINFGYGHNFNATNTAWDGDCAGSQSHQRLIKYDLGGLRCVLRSETDAYLPEKLPTDNSMEGGAVSDILLRPDSAMDMSLDDQFTTTRSNKLQNMKTEPKERGHAGDVMSVDDKIQDKEEADNGCNTDNLTFDSITVIETGTEVPQIAIAEIKTRTKKYDVKYFHLPSNASIIDQRCWITQTPNFIFAEHKAGNFSLNNISVSDVRNASKVWEDEHQDIIRKLVEVVKGIGKMADNEPSNMIEVRRRGTGELEIWTARDAGADAGVLPEELKARWLVKQESV